MLININTLDNDRTNILYELHLAKDEKELKVVNLEDLTVQSDYITLHVPMNNSTKDLFNLERLEKMKNTSRIINVARGGIVNESDLEFSLKSLDESIPLKIFSLPFSLR